MGLDAARALISAHRLGGNYALGPETGLPADGCRYADAETLGRLPTGGSCLDGGQNTLAQVHRQGSRHNGAPAKVVPSNHNSNAPTTPVDSSRTETALAGFFLVVDTAFFTSNLVKLLDGGYVPLLLAAGVYGVMWIWHHGTQAVAARIVEKTVQVGDFTAQALAHQTPRVPGTAVFLTRTDMDVPPSLVWHLEHNKALHERIVILTVETGQVPYVAKAEHLGIAEIAPNYWRAKAKYGFMEHPDIPTLLRGAADHGCDLGLDDATYYVGHATIMHRDDGQGMPRWLELLYAAMERNASHVGDVLRLPPDETVELGRQVSI